MAASTNVQAGGPAAAAMAEVAVHPEVDYLLHEMIDKVWAKHFPDRMAYRWCDDHAEVVRWLTYGQLAREVRRMGWYLHNWVKLKKGDIAVLWFMPSLDFIVVFLACLMYGIVPFCQRLCDPQDRPDTPRRESNHYFFEMLGMVKPAAVLTDPCLFKLMDGPSRTDKLKGCTVRFVDTSKFPLDIASTLIDDTTKLPAEVRGEDRACILHTEYDTRLAILTHAQLRDMLCAYATAVPISDEAERDLYATKFTQDKERYIAKGDLEALWRVKEMEKNLMLNEVPSIDKQDLTAFYWRRNQESEILLSHPCRAFSWLPLSHGAGLIYFALTTAYLGMETLLTSPLSFWNKPVSFLSRVAGEMRCSVMAMSTMAMTQMMRKAREGPVAAHLEFLKQGGMVCGDAGVDPVIARKFLHRVPGLPPSCLLPIYELLDTGAMLTGRHQRQSHSTRTQDKADGGEREGDAVDADGDGDGLDSPRTDIDMGGPRVLTIDMRELAKTGTVKVLSEVRFGEMPVPEAGRMSAFDKEGMPFVSHGAPADDVDLRIVNPFTREVCPAGVCGEIYFKGSVVCNYFHPIDMQRYVQTRIKVDDDKGQKAEVAYYRTHDVGFMHDGELFLLGSRDELFFSNNNHIAPRQAVIRAVQDSFTSGARAPLLPQIISLWPFSLGQDLRCGGSHNNHVVMIAVVNAPQMFVHDNVRHLYASATYWRECVLRDTGVDVGAVVMVQFQQVANYMVSRHNKVGPPPRREAYTQFCSDFVDRMLQGPEHVLLQPVRLDGCLQLFPSALSPSCRNKTIPPELHLGAAIRCVEIWHGCMFDTAEDDAACVLTSADLHNPAMMVSHNCAREKMRAEYKELCKRALELPQQCTDFMYLFQTAWQNLLHTATDAVRHYVCELLTSPNNADHLKGLLGLTPGRLREMLDDGLDLYELDQDRDGTFYGRELSRPQWDSLFANLSRIFGAKLLLKIEREKDKDKKSKAASPTAAPPPRESIVLRVPCPHVLARCLLHLDATKATAVHFEMSFRPLSIRAFHLAVMMRNATVALLNHKIKYANQLARLSSHAMAGPPPPPPAEHPHQQQQQQYPCVDCPLFPFESGTLQKILDPKAADWDGFAKSVGDVNEPMKERDVFRRIRYMLGRSCLGQDLLVVHACDDTTRHLAHHLIDQRGMAAAAGAIVIGRKPSPGREGRAE
ncbi:unnamed protein product [Vitrella brassicaformis CCMP3155]|uniref:AMP-dependent synthetase/ligase domain-containing protein n=3 Tax=Vitrella brassicaformis TaxID=1169539 RepID=A0A0G4GN90_VITBC|nr:unnamed protein product [Vitrella brassicaformis CCMP3155]|eukprot:CEM31661.1 unnamed protein product [Vitrella brassicaformis CCMP3155]